jgi:hypothetical protein
VTLLFCMPITAHAADLIGLDGGKPPLGSPYIQPAPDFWSDPSAWLANYLAHWYDRVDQAQASQPHWMTPVVTVTPRLEQEFRYDQLFEHLGNDANLYNFDGGKGLELIPTTTNEVIFNLPPYLDRTDVEQAHGLGDWPFFLVKQRLLSANEENGNYILTAFLAGQAPVGASPFTNHTYVVTPTLAGGKGWGNFDIQATVGVPIPTNLESTVGTSLATNVALQYHLGKYFWPEFEFNDTYWFDGEREGKNQLFLTPGIIFGRFPLGGRKKLIVGVAYQFAVSKQTFDPLTPMYDRAWLLTSRLAF